MKLMSFGASPSAEAAVPAVERASAGEFTHVGAPAGELLWVEFDLPIPPSVNQFTKGLGNQSLVVKLWVSAADGYYCLNRRRLPHLVCPFEVELLFQRHKGDLDNRIKPTLDWMQRVKLISNDKLCEKLTVMWGSDDIAPLGLRVRLRPWMVSA